MPIVTIDGLSVEVEAGTNLIEAARKVGIQIPHYCYHPRLSVVGQCRMCLVKLAGIPKLQTACSTPVTKDGMVVQFDDDEVKEALEGVMEFLLINHPLDCPICDQAGECGLQDYSFKHGQAFSRFPYKEKRTYPGRERIPLGPTVVLNMNRCIQCTRCIRFTEEISKTGELGFFQRGARTEIGVFPGMELDNPLSGNVVDICPVGALTSKDFRFAERVWYLEKTPSICTGCDIGCNITLEHRSGDIKRYKPRFNPEVNDYWMCDYGRLSHRRYKEYERLLTPRRRTRNGEMAPCSWDEALAEIHQLLSDRSAKTPDSATIIGSGFLSTEEAYLLRRLADSLDIQNRYVWVDAGPERIIPTAKGDSRGSDCAPNRRGALLAGLGTSSSPSDREFVAGREFEKCSVLLIADSNFGKAANEAQFVEELRKVDTLIVFGWADTRLARAADIALPLATPAETSGSYVNAYGRIQRFEKAYAPVEGAKDGVTVFADLLSRFDENWTANDTATVLREMVRDLDIQELREIDSLPAHGIVLASPTAPETASVGTSNQRS